MAPILDMVQAHWPRRRIALKVNERTNERTILIVLSSRVPLTLLDGKMYFLHKIVSSLEQRCILILFVQWDYNPCSYRSEKEDI